ncbi:MAG: hypothetical protein M3P48_04915 [Actinomycetota bacterium]|nr:hypothetical protein [Actinomycetota bacterium]
MASNTGRGFRHGAVTGRSQTRAPGGNYVKRNTGTGQFMDQKQGGAPFKGVRREK